MKKIIPILMALLLLAGCAQSQNVPTQTLPPDKEDLPGQVTWMTAAGADTEEDPFGYEGTWCLQISDTDQWETLVSQYGIRVPEGFAPDCANRYVILVMFWDDTTGSSFELSELGLKEGMAHIVIHETASGAGEGEELIACVVEVEEEPFEIDSYRDDISVG